MHTLSTPRYSSHLLVLHRFVHQLGLRLPKSDLREMMTALPEYPLCSLKNLYELLALLQLEPALERVASADLPAPGDLPVITSVAAEAGKHFVVLLGLGAAEAHYYSAEGGEVTEPAALFLGKWNNALVLKAQGAPGPAAGALDAPDEEQLQAEQYRAEGIRVLDDFLSPEACAYIIGYCERENAFRNSEVESNGGVSVTTATRTSFSAMLPDRQHPVMAALYDKVATCFGVDPACIENLQCVKYGTQQEYRPHFDSSEKNQRLYTILVYLNDDFGAGETYFPELNLKVVPKRGRALFFVNRDARNQLIPFSIHAGLSVRAGVKYACNIWVRRTQVN